MGNERLRAAMNAARVTMEEIAEAAEVSPKTVHRWLKGRKPHTRNRWAVSKILDEDEDYLWPPGGVPVGSGETATFEVVGAYAHRAVVPPRTWWKLLVRTEERVELLGYAMLHLPEQHPELMEMLAEQGEAGTRVRIALADPKSSEVRARDREEQLAGGLVARIKIATKYFSDLLGARNVEIRQHATPLYNSIFRFDDHMYVTPHLFGIPGAKAPLLHLKRRDPTGIFERFVAHFEGIWDTAHPLEAP